MSTTYNVHAKQWRGGWELHINGEGVTQVRTLANAEQQVRDYLESMNDRDFSAAKINLHIELGGLEAEAHQAREATRRAAREQKHAAEQSRKVARKLRAKGVSVSDTATVLGVSRGRVSQLTKV